MFSMEELLFGIAESCIEPVLAFFTIALIFDFARMLLFSK